MLHPRCRRGNGVGLDSEQHFRSCEDANGEEKAQPEEFVKTAGQTQEIGEEEDRAEEISSKSEGGKNCRETGQKEGEANEAEDSTG